MAEPGRAATGPVTAADDCALRVGPTRIVPLFDALVDSPAPIEARYPATPPEAWEPWRARHPETFWEPRRSRFPYTCYLIQRDGSNVLVDAAMGPPSSVLSRRNALVPPRDGRLHAAHQLLDALGRAGVEPGDVDMVLFSHLDAGHVGWALTPTADGGWRPTFDRAIHLAHQVDWEALHSPGWDTLVPFDYVAESVTPLGGLGVLRLITAASEELLPGVELFRTPGHTPGHLSVRVSDGDEVVYLAGDALVHPAQVANPGWHVATDRAIEQAAATRLALVERAEREGALVAASHFPHPCFGHIAGEDGERRWRPLAPAGAGEESAR